MFEPRRVLPRLVSTLLVSAAAAILAVPAAQSAAPEHRLGTAAAREHRLGTAASTANGDLYRGQQWTLGALHIPRAWKYSRGNGVTVAVLDTGVDGHQVDLAGRVIDGPDYTGHARRPGSRYWGRHGTQMASIIAGHGHGPGGSAGVMGVAPEAKILSIRVTWEIGDPMREDAEQVNDSRDAIAEGIRYAADHGADVISMSLGGGKLFYDGNPVEEAAIKYALGKGIVLVASSGNDGDGPNRRNYPAAYPGVIAVGAVDRAFQPAKFTNHHTYVALSAPGVEIVSADASGHGYVLGTGTSASAALVAGISALIKARFPELTPDEVKQALQEGTTHRPPDGRNPRIGTGVADAYGALRAAAHINKAEHRGAAVRAPRPSTTPAASAAPAVHAAGSGPDLMLVAVLSGGGTLIVLSLILGWRQRRRRLAAEAEEDELLDVVSPGMPEEIDSYGRSSRTSSSWQRHRSSGPSPWEPRESSSPSPWEPRDPAPSPWERRESSPSPWEPREPARSAWEQDEPARPAWEQDEPARPAWEQDESARPAWEQGEPARSASERDEPGRPAWDPAGSSPPRTPEEASPWSATGASADAPPPAWQAGESPASPDAQEPRPSGAATGPPDGRGNPATADRYDPAQSLTQPLPVTGPPPEPNTPVRPAGDPPSSGGPGAGEPGSAGPFPDEADPLRDGPIGSAHDVGTPLADESWESIHRGFDRLKEDARNWGPPGGETGG